MRKRRWLLVVLMLVVGLGCEETDTELKSERIEILTQGIWEVSEDTEVGQPGVQINYYSDGTAQVRETASSEWYPDSLQWTMSDDGEELTMTGTDGPGTMDKVEILELTSSICRGRIIESSSSDSSAIGKTMITFKAEE